METKVLSYLEKGFYTTIIIIVFLAIVLFLYGEMVLGTVFIIATIASFLIYYIWAGKSFREFKLS